MRPAEGELPPLPPASGTAIGYLIDNASVLTLRENQLEQLKQIDVSLAARNDSLDTQLRGIERPLEAEAPKDQPPPRHNNAPGAMVKTTPDAAKLHEAKASNQQEALTRAFELLDEKQRDQARRLLDERGIKVPGGTAKPVAPSAPIPDRDAPQPGTPGTDAAGVPHQP